MNLDMVEVAAYMTQEKEMQYYEERAVIDIQLFWTGRQMEQARA